MKNTRGPSHPSSSSPKMQSWSHPSTQGHQPVHPDCPLAWVPLRDGPECPPIQLVLVLICLHWVCSRDPQHAKIRQRFQPSILNCQERWLWGSGCNSWYQGQSILPGLHATQNVRDDAIGLGSIRQISLGVQDPDPRLIWELWFIRSNVYDVIHFSKKKPLKYMLIWGIIIYTDRYSKKCLLSDLKSYCLHCIKNLKKI